MLASCNSKNKIVIECIKKSWRVIFVVTKSNVLS